MGKSRKYILKVKKQGRPAYIVGHTVADMNAAAYRAIAVTPGAIAPVKTMGDLALMHREASHP